MAILKIRGEEKPKEPELEFWLEKSSGSIQLKASDGKVSQKTLLSISPSGTIHRYSAAHLEGLKTDDCGVVIEE
jgi:hypothetical protein